MLGVRKLSVRDSLLVFRAVFDEPCASLFLSLAFCAATTACTDHNEAAQGSELNDVLDAVASQNKLPDLYDVEEKHDQSEVAAKASNDIYAPDRLPLIKIILDPYWETALKTQPREYVPVMLELIDGEEGEHEAPIEVGLKLKGAGSFRELDKKAALRIRIDKYQHGQRLRGLKALTLNNMLQDSSLMAERLAYVAFRELGVPAPRANHALVYINDVYYGVYANMETPNEDFLARWFQDPTRNLYEQAGWDFDHEDAAEGFELETNKNKPDDRAALYALQEACINHDLARARELVDWPKFMLFSALEAAVNQVDGYSYGQTVPNNYRVYDSEAGLVFLPWGLDWALGNVLTQDGSLYVDPFWVRPSHGVLIRMCLADEQCTRDYAEVVEIVASRWDDLKLEEHLDQWSEQIDQAFRADDRRESTVQGVLDSREVRRTIIRGRTEALREDLAQHASPD
jgi:hypothetical protein